MKFAFLVYVSRSGSTMLARHLADSAQDLLVLPEFNFLIWLARAGDAAVRALSAEQLYHIVSSDYQLSSLNLQTHDLRALTAQWRNAGLRAIAEQTVRLYAQSINRPVPNHVVLKKGQYLAYADTVREAFPEAVFIHIYRDPRATVNSMLRTPTIYFPDRNMARGDAIFAARQWRAYMESVRTLQKSGAPVVELSYEELCRFPGQSVERILREIGAQPIEEGAGAAQGEFRVSAAEQEIHQHIHQQPLLERLDAWKAELTPLQGVAVEWVSEGILQDREYAPWFMAQTAAWKLPMYKAAAQLLHIWRTGSFYWNRLLFFAARRSEVWPRVRLMLQSRLKRIAHRPARGSHIGAP